MKKGMHRVVSASVDFSCLLQKVLTALLPVLCPLLKGREG